MFAMKGFLCPAKLEIKGREEREVENSTFLIKFSYLTILTIHDKTYRKCVRIVCLEFFKLLRETMRDERERGREGHKKTIQLNKTLSPSLISLSEKGENCEINFFHIQLN